MRTFTVSPEHFSLSHSDFFHKLSIMIKSFRTKDLEIFFHNGDVPNYRNIANPLARKLRLLNTSENLNDLRVPPRNNLEKLQSDREGQYSIRVNDRLR